VLSWQRLAWIEWRRSLTGQDNYDFFWLAMLLWLTLTLALLLWGSREGLLNKFVEVFLGNIEGVGIPIWVVANHEIDRELLQSEEIKLYPYREVERLEVALPGLWAPGGWAVSWPDPLWQMGTRTSPPKSRVPLAIILNKSLFERYFNCEAYTKALHRQLLFLPSFPSSQNNPLYCLENNLLWLDVRVGVERRELWPFQIYWQPRISALQPVAFLLPLSTFHTLQVSNYFAHLNYYPEGQRIKELMIWSGAAVPPSLESFKQCLGYPEIKADRITFKYPQPGQLVMACIKSSGLVLHTGKARVLPPYLTITEELESHRFEYDSDYLTIGCPPADPFCRPCENLMLPAARCSKTAMTVDLLKLLGGYQKALTYVKDRADLAIYLEKIKNWPQSATDNRPAFYVHPTYQEAYVRFLFIQKVIDLLRVWYTPFFLIFLVVLLVVQIGVVITHRKHHYGILLAKGVAGRQLYQMVLMQVILSWLMAFMMATLLVEGVRKWLMVEFSASVHQKPYIDHVSHFDLLPISWLDYGLVVFWSLMMSFLVVTILFRVPPQPAYWLENN